MTRFRRLPILAVLGACLAGPALADLSPYAGEQSRAIASLSAEDLAALEAGQGWGLARAAELNGYPGPVHVLDLAEALGLRADQVARIEAIYAEMNAEARTLGAAFIAAEAALDAAFKSGDIDRATLADLNAAAALAAADLREVHLAAHLATKPVLTRHQVVVYNRLRGYGGGEGHDHGGH